MSQQTEQQRIRTRAFHKRTQLAYPESDPLQPERENEKRLGERLINLIAGLSHI